MKKILVVEDDPGMRSLLTYLLRNEYEVQSMQNGLEAFTWLSIQNIPDLIITDIRMPQMDGFELLENLAMSGIFKNIPIIVVTGLNDPISLRRCQDLGAYACLVKPFTPSELLEKVAFPFVSKMFL